MGVRLFNVSAMHCAMADLLPHRFLFRYSFAVAYDAALPRRGKRLLKLPAACRLPDLGSLDGVEPFGDVRLAWNEGGLGISAEVRGKQRPPVVRPDTPTESDGLQVWLDTRNTQNIHRAGRFCHHFCFLPTGAGGKGNQPLAVQLPIARAREDAPDAHFGDVRIAADVTASGYRIEVWIPAAALSGFDPESAPQLGFYYLLQDAEWGQQFPVVGTEFPVAHDPSLWTTIELAPTGAK